MKTDYKNDVLSDSMNGLRRYKMITNDDGTVSFRDVSEYTQVGDALTSGAMNEIGEAINGIETLENNAKPSSYAWLNIESQTIKLGESAWLNVSSVDTSEGNQTVVDATPEMPEITVKKSGRYLVIVRFSINNLNANAMVDIHRKQSTNSDYVRYRRIGTSVIRGQTSMVSLLSTFEDNAKIKFQVTASSGNGGTADVQVGTATAVCIIPI